MNRGQNDHLSNSWLGKSQSREASPEAWILVLWMAVIAAVAVGVWELVL
jgi:hypothetical protein